MRPWRIAFIVFLLSAWENFPFVLIFDSESEIGRQIFGILALLALVLLFFDLLLGNLRIDAWDGGALLLFSTCIFTSVIYSIFLAPQPLRQWAFSVYTISPILIGILLKRTGFVLDDIIDGLLVTGFISSFLLLIVQWGGLDVLDSYSRGKGYFSGGESKIVFFKLQSVAALLIAVGKFYQMPQTPKKFTSMAFIILVTGLNVLLGSESRLATLAVGLTVLLSWILLFDNLQKLKSAFLGLPLGSLLTVFLIRRYLYDFQSFADYFQRDVSASYRDMEIAFFSYYFDRTPGTGFGFMSANVSYDNIVAFAKNKAGFMYGTGSYGMMLDDIGIYGALYQFGYVGLALVVAMTLIAAWALIRLALRKPVYLPAGIIGLLMLCYMISPIPMNFFTLLWTAHIGGLFWFMASEAARLIATSQKSERVSTLS